MLKISDMRGDVMGGFHNALYLGDVRERVRILEDAGAPTDIFAGLSGSKSCRADACSGAVPTLSQQSRRACPAPGVRMCSIKSLAKRYNIFCLSKSLLMLPYFLAPAQARARSRTSRRRRTAWRKLPRGWRRAWRPSWWPS
jgi:hypothetical protein